MRVLYPYRVSPCISTGYTFPSSSRNTLDIAVNCWPSYDASTSTSTINLEYELESPSLALHSLTITLPLPRSAASNLSISEAPTCGDYAINAQGEFEWRIEEISAELGNGNGSIAFEVREVGEEGEDGEVFFPVGVEFVAQHGVAGVDVSSSFYHPLRSTSDMNYFVPSP